MVTWWVFDDSLLVSFILILLLFDVFSRWRSDGFPLFSLWYSEGVSMDCWLLFVACSLVDSRFFDVCLMILRWFFDGALVMWWFFDGLFDYRSIVVRWHFDRVSIIFLWFRCGLPLAFGWCVACVHFSYLMVLWWYLYVSFMVLRCFFDGSLMVLWWFLVGSLVVLWRMGVWWFLDLCSNIPLVSGCVSMNHQTTMGW